MRLWLNQVERTADNGEVLGSNPSRRIRNNAFDLMRSGLNSVLIVDG